MNWAVFVLLLVSGQFVMGDINPSLFIVLVRLRKVIYSGHTNLSTLSNGQISPLFLRYQMDIKVTGNISAEWSIQLSHSFISLLFTC